MRQQQDRHHTCYPFLSFWLLRFKGGPGIQDSYGFSCAVPSSAFLSIPLVVCLERLLILSSSSLLVLCESHASAPAATAAAAVAAAVVIQEPLLNIGVLCLSFPLTLMPVNALAIV